MNFKPITDLVAATFTPFDPDGGLNLDPVPQIVDHLAKCSVSAIFINGTTGESPSLTEAERLAAATAFTSAAKESGVASIVNVGHEALPVSCDLAAHAAEIGAGYIGVTAPTYFKPGSVAALIEHVSLIADCAPELPIYYYHIPRLSGVDLDMLELLRCAERDLPNLVGIKYSDFELSAFIGCKRFSEGRYNMLFGSDEMLLAGLAMGADGAVGSTYNFLAPLYNRIIADFRSGDIESAQNHQALAADLIRIIISTAGLPGLKAAMTLAGFDCGPHRSPLKTPSPGTFEELRNRLEVAGFFNWNTPGGNA